MATHERNKVTRRDLLKAMGAGAISGLSPVALGDLTTNAISLERHTLSLPRWDADGFRAAFVSDLHVNSRRQLALARQALRLAIAERPDVILIGGDFVNAADPVRLEHIRKCLEVLADARCPVFSIPGNHDYWNAYPTKTLGAIAEGPGRLLRNESVEVAGVTIAGVDDALNGRHAPQFLKEGRHSRSLLAMLHEPDYVTDLPENVSLLLSGHSHGGQICWPGGQPLHTPRGARDYVKGFYPHAPVPVYVSRGVGTTGPTWRLFCPPEVAVLTLRAS